MPDDSGVLIIVTTAKEDGGKRATLAFSAACCFSVMGSRTCVFTFREGVVWGYQGESVGLSRLGMPLLEGLMSSFLEIGGEGMFCAACGQVCIAPEAVTGPTVRRQGFGPAGMASVLAGFRGARALSF